MMCDVWCMWVMWHTLQCTTSIVPSTPAACTASSCSRLPLHKLVHSPEHLRPCPAPPPLQVATNADFNVCREAIDYLTEQIRAIEAKLVQFQALSLPMQLIHGDLHYDNVMVRGRWAVCCTLHAALLPWAQMLALWHAPPHCVSLLCMQPASASRSTESDHPLLHACDHAHACRLPSNSLPMTISSTDANPLSHAHRWWATASAACWTLSSAPTTGAPWSWQWRCPSTSARMSPCL